jgi:hypothetical protein
MKRPPICLQVFPSLPKVDAYPLQEIKIRVVKYHNSSPLFDEREFVTSPNFTGYSPKGLSLTLEQCQHLYKYLPAIMEAMRNAESQRVSTKGETTKTESKNDTGDATSKENVGKDISNATGTKKIQEEIPVEGNKQ